MGRLNEKAALVTGAASGIGSAIGRLFAFEDARVLLTDIKDGAGLDLANELSHKGYKSEYLHP